ncbi:MAG: RNA polymerase primary sigma factor [Nitriliruptoraceae bacterium]|jgi:RNA polymerase primary sigma factor
MSDTVNTPPGSGPGSGPDIYTELSASGAARLPAVERFVDQDLFRMYLDEIGRVDLLTAGEEVDLGKRIAAGQAARARLEADQAEPEEGIVPPEPLEPNERVALRTLVRQGDAAHDRMVETNLRLVVSVAKRYRSPGITFADLVQEGNLGLLRAVEKFDPAKGYRFSTYATWWIRQTIGRGLTSQSRTIRIPSHLVELLGKARREERRLLQTLGREPTPTEIAVAVGVSVERLEELRRRSQTLSSLDAPVGDDAGASLGDLISDDNAELPADAADAMQLASDLRQALRELPDRERDILVWRFGLDGSAPRTLESVAGELGLTRERVRQLEVRALTKLRSGGAMGTDKLIGYLRS